MTPFEIAKEQINNGTLKTPSVSSGDKKIDYLGYQLAVHQFNLSIMAKGMQVRGMKLKQIKDYYGLKGRSAKDCLPQFKAIFDEYKKNFI